MTGTIEIKNFLRSTNFAILDCEVIRINQHDCIRRMYCLGKDGFSSISGEFQPCISFGRLSEKDRKSFLYCKKHIHKLNYYPQRNNTQSCTHAKKLLKNFIRRRDIKLLLYKGGCIERNLAKQLDIPSLNIENIGVSKIIDCHDPEIEVNCHYKSLIEKGCIFPVSEYARNTCHQDL